MTGVARPESNQPPEMEGDARSGKRAREEVQLLDGHVTVKQERQEEPVVGSAAAAAALVVSEAPARSPAVQMGAVQVDMDKLRCSLCSFSLKPPIYQCGAGHLVCCRCRVGLPDSACRTCGRRAGAAVSTYVHCPGLDIFFGAVNVPCPFKQYGCKNYVPYFQTADHQAVCEHALCSCPEPGCGFAGSPAMLLGHLTSVHSWPVSEISYGKVLRLKVTVPAPSSPARQWRLLLGRDKSLFVLAVGPLEDGVVASVVLVRGNTPARSGLFKCKFFANPPPEAAELLDGAVFLVTVPVRSTALTGGDGLEPRKEVYYSLPPQMLVKDSRELLLSVRIDPEKTAAGAAASPLS